MNISEITEFVKNKISYLSLQLESAKSIGDLQRYEQILKEIEETQETLKKLTS